MPENASTTPSHVKYPIYRQWDSHWGKRILNHKDMQAVGCLLCSLVSKIAGETPNLIKPTPIELDVYLDLHKGYSGKSDALYWEPVMNFASQLGVVYKQHKSAEWTHGSLTASSLADFANAHKIPLQSAIILKVLTLRKSHHFVLCVDISKGILMDPGVNPAPDKVLKGFTHFATSKYKLERIDWFT